MSLRDSLTEIDGVGEVTADKIIDVVKDEYSNETVKENLEDAISYYEQQDYSYAGKYLYRALEEL